MKNVKFSKRFLSMLASGILMVMPAMSNANSNENSNDEGFKLVKQEMKVEGNDLNLGNYEKKLENVYNYLKQYINYDNLQADLHLLNKK